MQYELISPPRPLADYIRYCWRLENQTGSVPLDSLNVVADGCPGILYAQSGEIHRSGRQLPPIILYGQSVEPTRLELTGRFTMSGICFYPDALKTLFGLNAVELTDTCTDLGELLRGRDTHLPERLWQSSAANSLDGLFSYLSDHLRRSDPTTDPAVTQAVRDIVSAGGNVSLRELQHKLRLSERSLERRFNESVGLSPKLFSRICRFQAALNQLKRGQFEKLSDVAYERGYADQSHFIRTFKEFTGILPEQYQMKGDALSDALTNKFPQLTTG